MDTKLEVRINQFTDTMGRKWPIKMTVGKVRQVRDRLGVDITDAIDPTKNVVDQIANDPVLMFDIIYLCVQEKMEQENIEAQSLADAISGDTIEEASVALINAIIDFFPKSKTEVIRESLALKEKMIARIKKKSLDSVRSLTEEDLDRAVSELVQKLGSPSIPAPESSA